jgi:hypothetical protein
MRGYEFSENFVSLTLHNNFDNYATQNKAHRWGGC